MDAKEFLKKYLGPKGRVELNETGLKFNALDPNSAFIRDVGGLSDVDFFAV